MSTTRTLVDRLNGRARRNTRMLFGVPLLLLGAGLWLLELRNGETVETSCRVVAAEELGFLAVHLEAEVGGKLERSGVIASCRSAEERARGCGQPVGARVPCHTFKVEPGRLMRERPTLPVVPVVPALFLGAGVLLAALALVAWLRTPAGEDPPLSFGRIPVRVRSVGAIVLGAPLLLAGLGLVGLSLQLLFTSSSLGNDLGYFALLAGLVAALLGGLIGFSRSELRLERARGVLQVCRGVFTPFLRRSHVLADFERARVEVVHGRSSSRKLGSYTLHHLVLERASPEDHPLRVHFPDGERTREAADELGPLLGEVR